MAMHRAWVVICDECGAQVTICDESHSLRDREARDRVQQFRWLTTSDGDHQCLRCWTLAKADGKTKSEVRA